MPLICQSPLENSDLKDKFSLFLNPFGTEFLKISVHSQPELILQHVDKYSLTAGSCLAARSGR